MVKNNNSSAISVMTVDNAITNHSVGVVNDSNCSKIIDNQKKRKKIVEKNKDITLSKPKKRKTHNVLNICDRIKK